MSLKSFFTDLFHETPCSHAFATGSDTQTKSGKLTMTYSNIHGQVWEEHGTYRYTVRETTTEWLSTEKVGGDKNSLLLKHNIKSDFNKVSGGTVPDNHPDLPRSETMTFDSIYKGVFTEEQAIQKIAEWEADKLKAGKQPTTHQPFKSAIRTKLTR